MKNALISGCLWLLLLLAFGCTHDEFPIPNPGLPPDEFVPIYHPCDTSTGAATANKLNTPWKSGVSCRSITIKGKLYRLFDFETCTEDGSQRENLTFGGIPIGDPEKVYKIKGVSSTILDGIANAGYGTSTDDGDLAEDYYYLDSNYRKNYLVIEKWDTINKRAEGSFSVAFDIDEPRRNAQNPKHVVFTAGKFWVKIPD